MRDCCWLRIVAVCALTIALGIGPFARQALSHPLHTTLTEVTVAADGTVTLVIRAFVDDFAAAIAGRPVAAPAATATPTDSASARYLAANLVIVDEAGRRIPLAVSGTRRASDVIWVTLRSSSSSRRVGAMRLTNRVLFERFDDQVNIVQSTIGGRRQTLLFTKKEGVAPKALTP